jgi:hypothetical protein
LRKKAQKAQDEQTQVEEEAPQTPAHEKAVVVIAAVQR